MLPKNLWKEWEPRVVFPIYHDCLNSIDFAVNGSLNSWSLKSFASPAYFAWQKQKSVRAAAQNYKWLLLRSKIHFRGAFWDRSGKFLGHLDFSGSYGEGDFFSANVNEELRKAGLPLTDGMITLIASRGRNDRWNSSPGNVSIRYVSDNCVSGYRTGFFSRPLNSKGKSHFGFTGINPQIIVDKEYYSTILLQNHSSDLDYDKVASPTIWLSRTDGETLEAPFGEIPPFGTLERSIPELFPDAEEFLKPNGGRGCAITKVKGISLASVHIVRARDGRKTVGMDHSRPAHATVVDYMSKPAKKEKPS